MSKNAQKPILLLIPLAFLMASCSSLQPLTDVISSSDFPKKEQKKVEPRTSATKSFRKNIVKYADDYIGAKYKYAARGPKQFDCSGFTHYVFKKFDIDLTPVSRSQAVTGKKVSIKNAQSGDLIFFGNSGKVSHVALIVSNDNNGLKVIHSTSSKGVIVQDVLASSYWKPKIMFVRDVIGH